MINIYLNAFDDNVMTVIRDLRSNNRNIKIWISDNVAKNRKFLGLGIKDVKNITDSGLNNNIMYFLWDVKNCTVSFADESQKNLYHRANEYGEEYIVIDAQKQPKDRLTMFADAIQDLSLPLKFTVFSCFCDSSSLFDYFENRRLFEFSLKDTSRFDLDAGLTHQENVDVYREKNTGNYWYLDRFHKNHYEVFDNRRIHIGEASLAGYLDTSKKKEGRTI